MPYIGSAVSKSTDIKRITFATTTTGSGPFALGWTPASENTLRVTVNGVVQQDSSMTLSGANLTLVGVTLVSGDELEVQGIVDVGGLSGIPADGTVTESKIGSGAVTAAKIGADAVGASAIATGAVGASELAANSITVAQMARAGTSGQVLTSAGTGADAAWAASAVGGKVLQLLEDNLNTTVSTTSTSYVTSGLSIAITPASTSSKFLLILAGGRQSTAANGYAVLTTFYVDGSEVAELGPYEWFSINEYDKAPHSAMCLHSPSTISSTTYAVFYKLNTGGTTAYFNAASHRATFTVMELSS